MHCCNSTFFTVSTLSELQMLLSCLPRPRSSHKGRSSEVVACGCASNSTIRFSVLFIAFSTSSQSSMSSALAMSDAESSSFVTLFSMMACQAVTLPSTGMLKPKSQSPSLLNISAMTPTFLSLPRSFIKVSVTQFSMSDFEIIEMDASHSFR